MKHSDVLNCVLKRVENLKTESLMISSSGNQIGGLVYAKPTSASSNELLLLNPTAAFVEIT
jgi:hypothetical protein